MGNQLTQSSKKLIAIDNLTQQISKCQELGERKCPIYGTLHRILYKSKQIEIGKSLTNDVPHLLSLHYIIQPNIIMVPPHHFLENTKLSQYQRKKQLVQLILGICQLQAKIDIGLSCNRVAFNNFNKKWCIVGDVGNGLWNYQAVMKNVNDNSIYFSPQLMQALSKDKLYPKINVKQSDVFIFAVMLLEIMVQKKLQPEIYNFNISQIKLGPIVQALFGIQDTFGKDIYEMLVKMLELTPQTRLTFEQIKKQITQIVGVEDCYLSPINQKLSLFTPPPNVKPKLDSFSPSPQIVKNTIDYQQSRGRSPGAIKKNLILTDRDNNKKPFSPIKPLNMEISQEAQQSRNSLLCLQKRKRLSNEYKITPNRVRVWEGMDKQRPKVEPFGLRFEQGPKQKQCVQNNGDKKSFSRLKAIRF